MDLMIDRDTVITPVVMLLSGKEEDGQWIVYMQASNETQDQDKEVVTSEALQKSVGYYLTNGVISWDHQHKLMRDPKYIIGEPLDVKFTGYGETLVKGRLYQKNPIAQSVWANIQSDANRMGASIGGKVFSKSRNESIVTGLLWDETAITYKPVNDATFASVKTIPFPEFVKALTAGSGVDAGSFTGGRALQPESLMGSGARKLTKSDLSLLFNEMMTEMIRGRISSYDEMTNFVLDRGYPDDVARRIVQYVAQNMGKVAA